MLAKIKKKSPDLISRIVYTIPMLGMLYMAVDLSFYVTIVIVSLVFVGVYVEWKIMEANCIVSVGYSYWFAGVKVFYVVVMQFIVMMILYMHITGIWVTDNSFGLGLGVVVISTASVDMGAYFGGKYLSSYFPAKLAPNISKNKTVIGAVCGFMAGYIVYIVLCTVYLEGPRFGVFYSVYIEAFLFGMLPVACDLLQSKAKREAKVKDSSTILKDHGGLSDRTDTIKPNLAMFILLKFPF